MSRAPNKIDSVSHSPFLPCDLSLFFVVQLDKIMACVEDIDRGEPPRFKQRCDQALKLTVRAASCVVALLLWGSRVAQCVASFIREHGAGQDMGPLTVCTAGQQAAAC